MPSPLSPQPAVTRRLLYRMTLGRFRSPQSVVQSCDARVKGISSKMESYSTLGEQLQVRGGTEGGCRELCLRLAVGDGKQPA